MTAYPHVCTSTGKIMYVIESFVRAANSKLGFHESNIFRCGDCNLWHLHQQVPAKKPVKKASVKPVPSKKPKTKSRAAPAPKQGPAAPDAPSKSRPKASTGSKAPRSRQSSRSRS